MFPLKYNFMSLPESREKEQEKSDDSLSHSKNELIEEKDNSQHVALKLGLQLRSAILHGAINVDMKILGTLI